MYVVRIEGAVHTKAPCSPANGWTNISISHLQKVGFS